MRNISLHCLAGPLKGQTFNLQGGPVFLFGRYAKATFNMAADPAASHLHFLIDISENRVRITDLGSTNGLVINETHMGGKQGLVLNDFVTLHSGDTILAGACLFRLSVLPEEVETDRTGTPPGTLKLNEASMYADKFTAVLSKKAGPKRHDTATTDQPLFGEDGLPQIDGFSMIEKIGGGGRGIVFKAIKDDTGVAAAIKIMNFNRNKNRKQRSIEMFRREIQITRQLDHPNVIRYLGDGISAGAPFLALEYVDGGTLDQLIQDAPARHMELPAAIPLFIQLLEAVAHMHSKSLVHRDIKPKNILLDVRRGGSLAVKLSDMGLSCRFTAQNVSELLPIVSEGGTPAYMPPEQLTDLTRAIPQSDVFSAGATFYQMLTGSLLYNFKDADQSEVILAGNITPIQDLKPNLPQGIVDVITRSLSYNPENRYDNAQEMLEALKDALI